MSRYSPRTLVQTPSVSGWGKAVAAAGVDYGTATGGASSPITVDSQAYTLLTFTDTGTLTVTKAGLFDVYIVGGGGGGGSYSGGAGGGWFFEGTVYLSGNATVTVGDGGAGAASSSVNGGDGATSSVGVYAARGGAGAPSHAYTSVNRLRFPTGAGGNTGNPVGIQGYESRDGGSGFATANYGCGGGAGSGANGSNGTTSAGGAGGAGTTTSFTGSSLTFGGGGGGSIQAGSGAGAGGTGGGGAGGSNANGTSGTANTGGGAGGNNATANATAGGSGVAYIRFKI